MPVASRIRPARRCEHSTSTVVACRRRRRPSRLSRGTRPVRHAYIYDTRSPTTQWSEVVNLGTLAAQSPLPQCRPGRTPHMVLPSPRYGLVGVSYTADTAFHILNATTRRLVECIETPSPGGKVHTGAWHMGSDGALTLHLVDMTGKVHGLSGGGVHKYVVSSEGRATYEASVSTHGRERDKAHRRRRSERPRHPLCDDGGRRALCGRHHHDGGRQNHSRRDGAVLARRWTVGLSPPRRTHTAVAQYGLQIIGTHLMLVRDRSILPNTGAQFLPVESVDSRLSFCRANGELYMMNESIEWYLRLCAVLRRSHRCEQRASTPRCTRTRRSPR